jgi:predicted nucleic acid-binding protein
VIFVDVGAFLARHMAGDTYHDRAVKGWRVLEESGRRCFTSTFVLSEFLTLMGRRAGYAVAAARGRPIFASQKLTVLRPGPEEEIEALEKFEKFADQRVSFTDCLSFVLMKRHRLSQVFSFDHHFARAGFTLWPERE